MSEEEKKQVEESTEEKTEKGISRRDFVKGAAAGAMSLTAMRLLAACAQEEDATSEAEEENGDATTGATEEIDEESSEIPTHDGEVTQASWETAPDPIPDDEIIETYDTEVLVIGAGFAGVATACSAAENGAEVVVVEKSESWNGRGGGAGVADSRLMREKGLEINKEKAQAEWIRTCGSRVDESLVSLFFNRSGEAMDWLLDKAEADNSAVYIWGGYSKSELYPDEPGYHMIMGGDNINEGEFAPVGLLYNDSLEAGVEYVFNAPAAQLVKEEERVVGAIVETEEGYVRYNASKGVVLATGDIAADPEMLEYYAPVALNAYESQYTPVGVNTGDGHKMGLWAGAAMQEGDFPTMIHPQSHAWFHGPFMFVNQEGKRFFNEATWVQAKSLNIMRQKSGNVAFSVFDGNWGEDIVQGLPYGGGMFWDGFQSIDDDFDVEAQQATIDSYVEQGLAFRADSLEDLADQMGIDRETFLAEVEHYNELCDAGEDTDFFKEEVFLTPIREAPFYATKVGPALLAVVGGLQINSDLQCIDEEGNPIDGLYAVGNAEGSTYAVDYPINIPGNSHGKCLTWGYVIGQNLAEA